MARQSPRAKRKVVSSSRVPASGRAPVSPRKKRAAGSQSRGTPVSAGNGAHGAPRTKLLRRRRTQTSARATPKARRAATLDPERVEAILGILDRTYPDARCALHFTSPLELLIATILSAQCTDARVNQVTPGLFARYPNAAAFAASDPAELEAMIRSTGFYRMKARAIRECCADIVKLHGGEVPRVLEQLVELRGVGRKTANVVLGNAYGIPGIVVDTHVTRLANRLGFTRERDAVKIEFALMPIVPRERWTVFSHWLILHGRNLCVARTPRCSVCPVLPHCPRKGVSRSA